MKNLSLIFCLVLLISCNNKVENPNKSTNVKEEEYFSKERIEELKERCIKHGDSEAFGNLVDNYFNVPSKYYELLPIAMIMADKYNNDNARVSIYCQMIMMENEGKLNDSLFFNLTEPKKDFIVSYLLKGLKNKNPGCTSLLQKIVKGGYQIKNTTPEIEGLLKE